MVKRRRSPEALGPRWDERGGSLLVRSPIQKMGEASEIVQRQVPPRSAPGRGRGLAVEKWGKLSGGKISCRR